MEAIETLIRDVSTLVEKLGALGTAEQIRDYFVQEQITGQRRNGQNCPVHTYLVRELGPSIALLPLGVGPRGTSVRMYASGAGIDVTHPESVRRFISDFDNCDKYSELVPAD